MNTKRARKSWIALLAILLLLAACKGESPTAPPSGGGPPGGTPPPTGATLTLAASNTEPLVDSSVVLTATATLNGQPVPNGTAIEFSATGGVFDGGTSSTIIKTTTDGVATATLTNSVAGLVRVTATVNNVTRSIDITFKTRPTTPPPPSTVPVISSITPTIGRPSGGETIRITGLNFRTPVRVLFDVGKPTPVEAFVVSSTNTTIDVITPGVDLGAGQQLVSDVIVITEAGSATEQRVEATGGFTFRNEQLTPRISTATPNSGPVTGDTRVTIFGDGFQAPVQVLFGAAEARVVSVNFSEIIVMSPAARDTSGTGSGAVLGPVTITVRNINSQTSTSMTEGFRYINAMQITAAGPTEGPFTGGTRVSIDGVGFVAPVAVSIGGVAAMPVSVSGTKVIALTSGVVITSCGDVSGPIIVTNIVNGDSATGPTFTYRVPRPLIVNVSPTTVTAGQPVQITVVDALPGPARIKLGNLTAFVTAATVNPDGSTTFTVTAPTSFEFPSEDCTLGGVPGERDAPIVVDVTYTHIQSGCTDTAEDALTVEPDPADNPCVIPPPPPPPNAVITPNTAVLGCANMGLVASGGTTTGTTTFTITNTGGSPLIISSVTVVTSSNTTTVTVAPTSATVAPQASQTFTVTVDPAAAGAFSGTIRVNSNDPDTPAIDFCFTGTGT